MNSTNEGQIQQTFVFILFILVAGFIVILGYNAITGFTEGQCESRRLNFEKDMEGFFENYDSYGEVHAEDVNLPCKFEAVCFVNASAHDSTASTLTYSSNTFGANQVVLGTALNSKNNIFLVGEFTEPAGYSEKVRVPNPNVLCVKGSGGKVNLVFKGQGQATLVEEAS